MKITKLLILIIFPLWGLGGFAQEELSKEEKERRERNIQAANPFAKFGYKAKVATLSKGKYLEVHDLDSIVTIGTTRWHVDKNKIVGDIVIDSLNPDARPIGDVAGRWISPDPLSEEFPSWSPYNFCFDNPIRYIDPTGLAPETDFGILKNGQVKQIGPTDNKPDKLYALNNDSSINKNVKSITVNDKNLLPALTKASELKQSDGSSENNMLPVYYSKTKNGTDAMNVFKFLAENSPKEFTLIGNKKNEWALGTMQSSTIGAMLERVKGFEFVNQSVNIHSHGENTPDAFKPSGNDFYNMHKIYKVNPSIKGFIYMPQLNMKNWNKAYPNQKINYNPDKMYELKYSQYKYF
jgi:hypothetical protein